MLASLPPEQVNSALAQLSDKECDALVHDWPLWAREDQLPPSAGGWQYWLSLGGRGAGKTRTGGEWVRDQVKMGRRRIALVAPTAGDARDVMVEGESGLLNLSWRYDRDAAGKLMGLPVFEPSKRRITWANGARATLFSAEEPERLRGPQHDAAWADELCAWRYQRDTWDMLMFGLRLGDNPQMAITTTPKPQRLLKEILKDPGTVVSRASTYANRANLAPSFFQKIIARYEGTRLGRQEIEAQIIDDVPGALWSRSNIEEHRTRKVPADMRRVVVAVDPAVSSNEGSDENGIVVVGKGRDKRGYVLDDKTLQGSPLEWGRVAVLAHDAWEADCIVAEVNNGGDMVEQTIQVAAQMLAAEGKRKGPAPRVKKVRATRGKVVRAEPISALYEKGQVSHVGTYPQLEDQLCAFTTDFDRKQQGYSPDRLDALVWAFTEAMVSGKEAPMVAGISLDSPSYWTGV